jgi:hypothetical protein
VNESAQRVTADDSKQPQDQEDYKYCPEHFANTSRSLSLFLRTVLSLHAVLFFHFDNTDWTPSLVRKVVRLVMSFSAIYRYICGQPRMIVAHREAHIHGFRAIYSRA